MSSWKSYLSALRRWRTLGFATAVGVFAATLPLGADVARATVYEVTAFGNNGILGDLTVTGTFTSPDAPFGTFSFTATESRSPGYTYVFTNATGTTLPTQTPPICGFPPCAPPNPPLVAVLTPSFVPTGPTSGTASFELEDALQIFVADGTYGPAPNSGNTPEPSTWVLLILGFAGLGWAARRRVRDRAGLATLGD